MKGYEEAIRIVNTEVPSSPRYPDHMAPVTERIREQERTITPVINEKLVKKNMRTQDKFFELAGVQNEMNRNKVML